MADMRYNQGDSAFDYAILDASNNVIVSGSVADLIEWDKAPTLAFPCGSPADQKKIRFISTAPGTIDLDRSYLGSNKGIIPTDFKGETVEKILSANVTSTQTVSEFYYHKV